MALNLSGRIGRAASVQPKVYRGMLGRLWTPAEIVPVASDYFPGNPAKDVEARRQAGVTPTGHSAS